MKAIGLTVTSMTLLAILLQASGCRIETLPKDINDRIVREIDFGDYAAALSNLDKMQRFAAVVDMAWVHGERGYVLMKQRKYDAAVVEMTKSIEIDPSSASVYNNRGLSFENLGKLAEAEADYSTAIDLESDKSRRYTERAAFYFNVGRLEESLRDTEQAISLDAQDPENYLRRADTRTRLKQIDRRKDIIADLRKVIELQPVGILRDGAVARLTTLGIEP